MRRTALALPALLAVVVACKKQDTTTTAPNLPATRAAAVGDFPDNPLLAYVPADTPYAFATFKPIPADYVDKVASMFGPALSRMTAVGPSGLGDKIRALSDEIGTFDLKRFEELGFSAKARLVVYGLGVYPVMRIEIGNGDRVYEFVQRAAKRMAVELPPVTERDGHRYWTFTEAKDGAVVSIDKGELVVALVDPDHLVEQLPIILGDQKPAKAATTAMFRDIATRDGFNAQGVGYLDTGKLIAAALDAAGSERPSQACTTAIAQLAASAPRVALGYDELTAHRLAFGVVAELAPDVQAQASTLATKMAGIDRLLAHPPVIGMAAAFDLDHARALAPKIASAMRALGTACESPEIVRSADAFERNAALPLPAPLVGLSGGVIALDDIKMSGAMPEKLDGYAVLHVGDAGKLLELASHELPGFDGQADGKAHALPKMIPLPGHFAASGGTIAVAAGADSSSRAEQLLDDKPGPAPLMLVIYDYSRFFTVFGAGSPELAAMADMYKMLGIATVQVGVDSRGLVMWMSLTMK